MNDLTVAQIMQATLLACPPDTPILQAAKLMYAHRCSSIVVEREAEVVGIWTEKDVLDVDLADAGSLERPIRLVMSRPVRTIPATTSLGEATRRFNDEQVRHFLVVDQTGAHVGVISQTDIVLNQGIEYFLHLKTVQAAIGRSHLALAAATPLSDATARMRACGQSAAVVAYGPGDHGIITERDVVRLICEADPRETIGEIASRPLVCVPRGTSLFLARNVLAERHIRHLGVTDEENRLIALLSFPDIMSAIDQGFTQELQSTLRQREEALTLSRGRLRLVGRVFETTTDGIVITDANGVVQSANPAFQRLTGYEEHEMVGRNARMFSSGRHDPAFYEAMWGSLTSTGYWKGEIWNRKKNGEIYLRTMTVTGILDSDGQYCNFAAVHSDVISHEQSLERIHYLANHDTLTGLPNRSQFNDHLVRAVGQSRRHGYGLGVMVLDLDGFGRVNETLGYLAGDELLQATAALLVREIDDGTVIARLNADEFALLCHGTTIDALSSLAERLLSVTARPMTIGGTPVYVTASIGISYYPSDGVDGQALLQQAAMAVKQAKASGHNSYQFFTREMNHRTRRQMTIEAELRDAIHQGQLRLYYQPKFEIGSMRVAGMEALVRWQHPVRGLLAPGEFIPIAEEVGLIHDLNEWVLDTACRDAHGWLAAGMPDPAVAVNLSPCQFRQRRLIQVVRAALDRSHLPPALLELEITESMAMENGEDALVILGELVDAGVSVSIDDFGTGYSSFGYLQRYPVSTIKIDRSFIKDARHERDMVIPRAIISMAHNLGLKVVAEGIETMFQLAALRAVDCDIGQGYLFSRPLPPAEFSAFCTARLQPLPAIA